MDRDCATCVHAHLEGSDEPCKFCYRHNDLPRWEPRPADRYPIGLPEIVPSMLDTKDPPCG